MIDRLKKIGLYAVDRLKEPSSWAGVSAMLALLHHRVTSEQAADIASVGTLVAGIVAVAVAE